MASYFTFSSFLKWLESKVDFLSPLKAKLVHTFRLKACFLQVFLGGRQDVEAPLIRIRTVFHSAGQELTALWMIYYISSETDPRIWRKADDLISRIEERLEILNPDVQQVYIMLSKYSRSATGRDCAATIEYLNSHMKSLEDLLRCDAELVAPVKEELEAVQKTLRFLRNFLRFTAKRCSKHRELDDLIIHAEFLADKMSCLLYLCSVNDKMNDRMANEMKMHLSSELHKFSSAQPDVREIYIKSLKASRSAKGNSAVVDELDLGFLDSLRDDILELSNTNPSFMTSNKDQILSQHEELRSLITFFAMDKSSEEYSEQDRMTNYLWERINVVIIDTAFAVYELNMKLSALEANIMVAKEDTKKTYDLYVPKSLRSDFPRTNGQGFIGSLFRSLNEQLNTKPDLVAPLKHHIEIVRKELSSLREDFSRIAKQPSQCEELQSQWTRFLDTAYQTEFVIDSFLVGGDSIFCHKLGLFSVIEEVKTIKIELKVIKNKMTDDTSVHKPSQVSVKANFPKNFAVRSFKERLADEKSTTKLVIFGEEAKKIREQLTEGSQKLNILSIVGMPGIGKTTLADSVFQQSSVTYHFHVQARGSVSQVLDKRRLLLEILQQVTVEGKQYSDDDDDLDEKLYQSLKGRRYLIFLDDIWDIRQWKDIKVSFPDDEIGSRIIFTSRFGDIARQAGIESIKFYLSPLSDEKSWEMLQVKLFGNKSCPARLVGVGREIAANCKGLPLTIDLIAGVLRVEERKKWEKVAKSLMTIIFEDPEGQCRKVLEVSYQNLPDDLKPCFLYFAAFPEDVDIPTRNLILLWIAEGFVNLEKDEVRSLEEVAEDILNNLINRSLITVSKRSPLGGVKTCRVHDLLHEFALGKAEEENFMLKMVGKAKFSSLSSVAVHDHWRVQYRLCIHPSNLGQFLDSDPSGPRTRALICSNFPFLNAFSLNFSTFKLLRVLYIPKVPYYCPEIFTLIHLRFLAIDCSYSMNFSKVHKLRNLETFIMDGVAYSRKPHEYLLLDKVCNLTRLRHFCFGGYVSLRYYSEKIWEKSFLFENLRTLYHLKVSYEEDIEKILRLMPNLVQLKVLFYNPDGDCYSFPKLEFHKKLESLEVTHEDYYSPYPNCKFVSFPPYIKELVLSNFCVPWTEISEIGNLEYLEVLKLEDGAFEGPIWDMIDGQFPKLKYLSLCILDIRKWNAYEDHLSCLEQLHVENCRKLEELPFLV